LNHGFGNVFSQTFVSAAPYEPTQVNWSSTGAFVHQLVEDRLEWSHSNTTTYQQEKCVFASFNIDLGLEKK
jgi:hypothetical protein